MRSAHYLPDDVTVEAGPNESLLDAALRQGVPHAQACGGDGACSTCRVLIVDGHESCSEPTRKERRVADRLQFPEDMRLACQATIDGPVIVRRLVIDEFDIHFADVREHDRPVPVGREREVAVLFADIRDFTPLAETLPPFDVIYILRRILADAQEIITANGGSVTSFMGDGLMAVFGLDAPGTGPIDAVTAGVEIIDSVERRASRFEWLYHRPIAVNVGVNHGRAIVGPIGEWGDPPPLTAIGDAVNLASRIEQANKDTGTTMLVSAETFREVEQRVVGGDEFTLRLAGKTDEQLVVEVTGLR